MLIKRGLPPAVYNRLFHMGQEGIDEPLILRRLCYSLTTLHENQIRGLSMRLSYLR